jgi:hypothetical protein
LERLLVDLPLTSATSTTPSSASDRPVRFTVAILGETQRRWRWRVAPRLTAVGVLGGCMLDLRAATLTAPVTTITAVTVLSGVDVLVPPGVRVELSVYGLFGSADSLLPEQDLPPDAPVVRVRCFALLGGVEAKPRLRRDMRAVDRDARPSQELKPVLGPDGHRGTGLTLHTGTKSSRAGRNIFSPSR